MTHAGCMPESVGGVVCPAWLAVRSGNREHASQRPHWCPSRGSSRVLPGDRAASRELGSEARLV